MSHLTTSEQWIELRLKQAENLQPHLPSVIPSQHGHTLSHELQRPLSDEELMDGQTLDSHVRLLGFIIEEAQALANFQRTQSTVRLGSWGADTLYERADGQMSTLRMRYDFLSALYEKHRAWCMESPEFVALSDASSQGETQALCHRIKGAEKLPDIVRLAESYLPRTLMGVWGVQPRIRETLYPQTGVSLDGSTHEGKMINGAREK